MVKALKTFLEATAEDPKWQVKRLCIDGCGMQDQQLAHILEGIDAQGAEIKTFANSNNEMGSKSMDVLVGLVGRLRELQLNNILCGQSQYRRLLDSALLNGVQLMKLKLSNVNLNDNGLVDRLVELLKAREILTHLDLSWAKLSPK